MGALLIAMILHGGPNYTWKAVISAPVIWEEAENSREDPYLIAALAWVESRWNPDIVSRTNDCGFMQTSARWSEYSCDELKDLTTGIRVGIGSIKYWRGRFGNDWLCHYNSGNACYRRSRNYARKIRRVHRRLLRFGRMER